MMDDPGTEAHSWLRWAILAPSIHNSQPWRFRVRPTGVDVFADWSRRLDVIDPEGRQLVISVGAAVLNLCLAIHHSGHSYELRLCPTPGDPLHLAAVEVRGPAEPDAVLDELAAAVPRRHTNRLPFLPDPVAHATVRELAAAAAAQGGVLRTVPGAARGALGRLVRAAESRLRDGGVYRAELGEWRRPHHPVAWHAAELVPLRDFGLVTPFLRDAAVPEARSPTPLVLATDGDTVADRVRAGLALQRVWLTATARGIAVAPMSQPLDVPVLRRLVTDPEAGAGWAQVILLVGYAPPTAPTPRRDVREALTS
jgi:nitroreductase